MERPNRVKTLLLMRHATASAAAPGQSDFDRPLSPTGQADAARIGRWLVEQGPLPSLVISSSARRAIQTAAAVMDASQYGGAWEQAPSLYDATLGEYFSLLQQVPAEHDGVLVVAHNSGIEELVTALSGASTTMAAGALASLELPLESWPALNPGVRGRLLQNIRPREII